MLKDFAKVLFGFILGDMLLGIFLIAGDALPIDIFGMKWSFAPTMIAILTEFVILILLAYYAWIRNPGKKKEAQKLATASEEREQKTEQ